MLGVVLIVLFLVQLCQRKPLFLRFFQLIPVTNLLYVLFALIIPSNIIGYEHGIYGSLLLQIFLIVQSVGAILIWSLYYCSSIRVSSYMESDEFKEKSFIKFTD